MFIENLTAGIILSAENYNNEDITILTANQVREVNTFEFREMMGYISAIRDGNAQIVYDGAGTPNGDSIDAQISRIDDLYNMTNGYQIHAPEPTGMSNYLFRDDSAWAGGASQIDGEYGKGFKGNGTDGHIIIDSIAPTITDFVGIFFRLKISSYIAQSYVVSLKDSNDLSGAYSHPILVYMSGTGELNVYSNGISATIGTRSNVITSALSLDTWYDICITVDQPNSNPIQVYVDGVNDHASEVQVSDTSISPGDKFTIGSVIDGSSTYVLHGDIEVSDFFCSNNSNFKYYVDYFYNQGNDWHDTL
jgi:hypothetical protein